MKDQCLSRSQQATRPFKKKRKKARLRATGGQSTDVPAPARAGEEQEKSIWMSSQRESVRWLLESVVEQAQTLTHWVL